MNNRATPSWLVAGRCLAVVLLATCIADAVRADFRASFRRGIQAAEQERWDEVADAMREAIADRPAAQRTRVPIYSSKTVVYIPNTMLGIALAKVGDCAGAWDYFLRAETQGIAQSHDKERFGDMLREKATCRSKLVTEALAEAEPLILEAQTIRAEIDELLRRPGARETLSAQSTIAGGFEKGKQALAGAELRAREGVSNGNFEAVAEASRFARTAKAELATVRRDLDAALESGVSGALARAQSVLRSAEQVATKVEAKRLELGDRWTPALRREQATANESLGSARRELQRGRSASDRGRISAAIGHAESAQGAFESILDRAQRIARAPRPAPPPKDPVSTTTISDRDATSETPDSIDDPGRDRSAPPETPPPTNVTAAPEAEAPAALILAARAYFEGDYGETLRALSSATLESDSARAQGALFRAAAHFALYRLSGGDDEEQREQAAAAVAEMQRLGDDVAPIPRYFPPTFIRFVSSEGS